ncbi:zinc ribbon domain-containing protein [Variovorax dokdonensis]|uniref:Zinc ribbon domain-containing protein n=1 Tax=Variovorax dokdonensis TaxID=344883 RepID=A0ABT7N6Y8_9BURK|nr:FmdB family zinc ribbon protein [Variovorax dokdonensis]MDM0043703.1 zinc ribbon domain-containing protein [Variovorax dokdonensis]
MPIYAYKCSACGHAKDVLQKMSDAPLTDCPACGAPAFSKQLTAAGFQLKGSGWYVTDFRDGGSNTGKSTPATAAKSDGATADSSAGASAAPAATPAAAPAAAPAQAPAAAAPSAGNSS